MRSRVRYIRLNYMNRGLCKHLAKVRANCARKRNGEIGLPARRNPLGKRLDTNIIIMLYNTKKVNYLRVSIPGRRLLWMHKLRREQYIPFLFREVGDDLIGPLKHTVQMSGKGTIRIVLKRIPGQMRLPLGTLLWSMRSTRRTYTISQVVGQQKKSHGYRRLKKWARRKKSLQRVRARRSRYAL